MNIKNIAQYLQAQGHGTLYTDIFLSDVPDTPNNVIVINETGGVNPDTYLPTSSPTFQIYVRNLSYQSGYTKLKEIVADLHQKANVQLVESGEYFYYIFLMGEPSSIGKDEKKRKEFTANFVCKIRGR